ncbi:MAG: aldo/keto reductase [Aeromicrobium sp.]|uniref:aldo/keto reductase n=1 Tax=Aeromicrobium sp. TaxID=1871063 RepID=UPI0025B92B91|nr:aldo/keto reductase [Aeromicrobium sp.]MCK5890943.1 aldo/keto reductase [Aeromicrobium sp.]MDF1705137.1 aldo/keto reductase [Aeromicrobium sp.]
MQRRRVGHSGLRVSRLALGTMTWGTQVDRYTAGELLDAFLDAGGTLIDTAPVHGDGHAEQLLGAVLAERGVRDRVQIAGKCGLGPGVDGAVADTSRGAVLDQLDRTLRELQTDHLDLWQVHRWDDSVPLDETLAALEHAVDSGRVRYVGLSNFAPWQTALAHERLAGRPAGLRLVSTQVEYSLLQRVPESGLVDALQHLGMGLLAWSPIGRGVLTGKYRTGTPADSRGADDGFSRWLAEYLGPGPSATVEAVARAADGLGLSPAQVALAWVRDRPAVASAVVGARTPAQLSELLGTEELALPPEITLALDDVSSPR